MSFHPYEALTGAVVIPALVFLIPIHVALLHDENANGKADRALGMMPKEGFGFSRDAKVQMGPPVFDDAAVQIDRAPRTLPIKMRYML